MQNQIALSACKPKPPKPAPQLPPRGQSAPCLTGATPNYCSECGTKVAGPASNFCIECGKPLQPQQQTGHIGTTPTNHNRVHTSPGNSHSNTQHNVLAKTHSVPLKKWNLHSNGNDDNASSPFNSKQQPPPLPSRATKTRTSTQATSSANTMNHNNSTTLPKPTFQMYQSSSVRIAKRYVCTPSITRRASLSYSHATLLEYQNRILGLANALHGYNRCLLRIKVLPRSFQRQRRCL